MVMVENAYSVTLVRIQTNRLTCFIQQQTPYDANNDDTVRNYKGDT